MPLFHLFNRLFTSRIAVGLVLFLLLALLIWYGGPKLGIDGTEPLASQANRLIAIAVLAVLFLALEAFRRWRLQRLNRRILSSLGGVGATPDLDGRLGRVREGYLMLCEALRGHGGTRRRDRRHLYEQPWYLVLGQNSSGPIHGARRLRPGFRAGQRTHAAVLRPRARPRRRVRLVGDRRRGVRRRARRLRDRARPGAGRRMGRSPGLPEVGTPPSSAERHHSDHARKLPAARGDRAGDRGTDAPARAGSHGTFPHDAPDLSSGDQMRPDCRILAVLLQSRRRRTRASPWRDASAPEAPPHVRPRTGRGSCFVPAAPRAPPC